MLPIAATDLVGRDRDVRAVRSLLESDRLVTLVGSGGVGKTRLALAVAHEVEGDFEKVSWVELAHLDAGGDVDGAIRRCLDLPVEGADDGDWRHLDAASTLVVLDNCEQVMEEVVSLVSAITTSSRVTRLLATSRAVLGVNGEATYTVWPLPVPSEPSAAAMRSPAVVLFADRVRRVQPGFEVTEESLDHIVSIVQVLDGLPLALEIVAGHVRSFGLARLAAMVPDSPSFAANQRRDVDERHHTLAANLAWSRALLDAPGLAAMGELAVFVPDFSFEAAEAVLTADAAEMIPSLVAHSMLSLHGDRYRMLDVVRRDALSRVDPQVREDLSRRHARWCADLAAQLGHHAREAEVSMIDPAVRAEVTNLVSAISWCATADEPDLLVDIAGPLALTWVHVGWPVDDEAWLDAARRSDPSRTDNALLVMLGLAYRRSWRGDATGGRDLLDVVAGLATGEILANALVIRGQLDLADGNVVAARNRFDDAARLFDAGSSAWNRAYVRFCQARCEEHSDPSAAISLLEQGAAIASVDTYPVLHALILERQARFAHFEGRPNEALRLARESRGLHEAATYPEGIATSANREGFVLVALGRFAEAAKCHRVALGHGVALDHAGLLFDSLIGLTLAVDQLAGARTAGRVLQLAERYEPDLEQAILKLIGSVPETLSRLRLQVPGPDDGGHPVDAIEIVDSLDLHAPVPEQNVEPPRVAAVEALSNRELTVLRLLQGDLTQREIAGELIVAPSTVRSHVKAIYRKLGVSSRAEAVQAGAAAGLI